VKALKKRIRERDVERALSNTVKAVGGMCIKQSAIGQAGLPDRLVLLPKQNMFFVEVKAPGKGVTPLQYNVHEKLGGLGFATYVIDSVDSVKGLIGLYENGEYV